MSPIPAKQAKRDENKSTANGSIKTPKRFHCNQCGRGFTRSDGLQRHLRLHSGYRPFICTVCRRSFSRSDHAQVHIRRHFIVNPSVIQNEPANAHDFIAFATDLNDQQQQEQLGENSTQIEEKVADMEADEDEHELEGEEQEAGESVPESEQMAKLDVNSVDIVCNLPPSSEEEEVEKQCGTPN